ncbi:hypothetical protein SDJN02_04955, partial [Cucurbita argyrosperma subsp. argyrosperma]
MGKHDETPLDDGPNLQDLSAPVPPNIPISKSSINGACVNKEFNGTQTSNATGVVAIFLDENRPKSSDTETPQATTGMLLYISNENEMPKANVKNR